MNERVQTVCHLLHKHMKDGKVTPFLGVGATLADREPEVSWRDGNYLPNSEELVEFLAKEYAYPSPGRERQRDLVRVAQYAEIVSGGTDLVKDLHATFAGPQEPNSVHCYLAEQVSRARSTPLRLPNPWPVIVTTNYDDLLERAFQQAGEPCDVVTYFAKGGRHEKPIFMHRPPDGEPIPIAEVEDYSACDPQTRTVIVKLHGSIDRDDPESDSFVITENDYIAYIERGPERLLPPHLLHTMTDSHFLFLGYKLEDWHVRAFLFALWRRRRRSAISWAIECKPSAVASAYWKDQKVDLVKLNLKDWVEHMLALEAQGDQSCR
jgi:SIR2-like domain